MSEPCKLPTNYRWLLSYFRWGEYVQIETAFSTLADVEKEMRNFDYDSLTIEGWEVRLLDLNSSMIQIWAYAWTDDLKFKNEPWSESYQPGWDPEGLHPLWHAMREQEELA